MGVDSLRCRYHLGVKLKGKYIELVGIRMSADRPVDVLAKRRVEPPIEGIEPQVKKSVLTLLVLSHDQDV